jgi:hypothetical protein
MSKYLAYFFFLICDRSACNYRRHFMRERFGVRRTGWELGTSLNNQTKRLPRQSAYVKRRPALDPFRDGITLMLSTNLFESKKIDCRSPYHPNTKWTFTDMQLAALRRRILEVSIMRVGDGTRIVNTDLRKASLDTRRQTGIESSQVLTGKNTTEKFYMYIADTLALVIHEKFDRGTAHHPNYEQFPCPCWYTYDPECCFCRIDWSSWIHGYL